MPKFFRHYLLPQSSNNHRAKIIQNFSIFVLVLGILSLTSFSIFVKRTTPSVLGISYSISDVEMLSQVNNVRAQNNLPPLTISSNLSNAASLKASHMFMNNYWAHFAPDGTTPWSFIRSSGYDYLDAGENLAKGFTNSSDVVNAWMNSETHRANILSSKYKDIGFAIVPGTLVGEETVLIVQMFGSRGSAVLSEQQNSLAVLEVPAESINIASIPAKEQIRIVVTQAPEKSAPDQIQVATLPEEPLVMSSNSNINTNSAVNSFFYSKSILLMIFVTLLIVFIFDLLIIERRKIPRIVGHNLEHIMLLTIFILFILLFKNGFVI